MREEVALDETNQHHESTTIYGDKLFTRVSSQPLNQIQLTIRIHIIVRFLWLDQVLHFQLCNFLIPLLIPLDIVVH